LKLVIDHWQWPGLQNQLTIGIVHGPPDVCLAVERNGKPKAAIDDAAGR
jgi:hypothetical protein